MQKSIHSIVLALFLGLLSACANPISAALNYEETKGKHYFWTPEPAFLKIPDYDTSYGQGFRDGCNTSIGFMGGGMLRMHDFAYDVNKGIEDREYYKGYRMGTVACVYYIDADPL